MKTVRILTGLVSSLITVLVIQAFYPAPEIKEQQLQAKANLFNLRFPQEKIYLHLDRPSYWSNDDIWFKAYLQNSPILDCNLYVELLNTSGTVLQKKMYWVQHGLAYGDMHLADTIPSGVYQIRAYTNWMRNFDDCWFFRKNLVIWNLKEKVFSEDSKPLRQKDIDLQFFPEGGTFVTNSKTKMAFKVTDQNGKGLDVEGTVLDDQGSKVASFKSHFKGMGSFMILPQEGRKYSAQVTVAGKIALKVDLPVPQAEGVTLAIDPNDQDTMHIQVSEKIVSSKMNLMSEYLLIGQTNGVVFYRKEIKTENGIFNLGIGKDQLHSGITQFTLFDNNQIPRCERLVFVNHHDFVNVQIEPDKASYLTREKVQLNLKTITGGGNPCLANLSMAVYNPETELKIEDYPNTILSQFLLNSELKGNIEDPGYYFKDDSLSTLISLDDLMLSHGYRYFEWKEIMEDRFPEIVYPPEESITVKGAVKSIILEKPISNCKVTMLFLKNQSGLYEQKTDSLGQFLFSNLYFNDTVFVSLQAVNPKGKKTTVIELDERSSVSPKTGYLPVNTQYIKDNSVNTRVYLSEVSQDLLKKKWGLSDTILLGDINVVGVKSKKNDGHFRAYGNADFVYDLSKHDEVLGNIFEMLDGRLPGVRFEATDNTFWIRGNTQPALLLLDGIPVQTEMLSSMPISSFDKIEVVKYAPMLGSKGNNGAIFFYLKRGGQQQNVIEDGLGMKSTMVIGYSVIRKFYSPQYEVNTDLGKEKDFRSTLYWNPIVRTDSTGVANVSFYNSDQTGEVQVVVEGITSDGKLCRGLCKYNVTK